MRTTPVHKAIKRLVQITTLAALGLGLLFWKIDYFYEVALFYHLSHTLPPQEHNPSKREIQSFLFDLTTHQISPSLHIKGEKSPLVFLLNGYALCDQQAKVLTRLLYFQNINARAVPLYFDSGLSNHTIFEWHDGKNWVIADPFLHLPINLPAREFCDLNTQSVLSEAQRLVVLRAHSYYEANQGLLRELRETYARPDHSTWEYFRRKPENIVLEWFASAPVRLWPAGYLDLLNFGYRWRHFREDPAMRQFAVARHFELIGECQRAIDGYKALLPHVRKGGLPMDRQFALNQSALKRKIVANRIHCTKDHPSHAIGNT